jgi:hypothetical protein
LALAFAAPFLIHQQLPITGYESSGFTGALLLNSYAALIALMVLILPVRAPGRRAGGTQPSAAPA